MNPCECAIPQVLSNPRTGDGVAAGQSGGTNRRHGHAGWLRGPQIEFAISEESKALRRLKCQTLRRGEQHDLRCMNLLERRWLFDEEAST